VPPGDWIISDENVLCEDNDSLLINGDLIINGSANVEFRNCTIFLKGSLFLKDVSVLTLNQSEFIFDISSGTSTPSFYNFTSENNTKLLLYKSLMKNNLSDGIAFDISGKFDMNYSTLTTNITLHIFGEDNHSLSNSFIKNLIIKIFPASSTNLPNKWVEISNITFGEENNCMNGQYFETEVNTTIINSNFYCKFRVGSYGSVEIHNSTFLNVTELLLNSKIDTYNTNFTTIYITDNTTYNSVSLSNITLELVRNNLNTGVEAFIYGEVDMPTTIDWSVAASSEPLTRYYPIYLHDQFNRPLANWHVNITNNLDGSTVSSGITDENGFVELNITFNASNYGPGNFTLNWNGSADISLYNDTPIYYITETVNDYPPHWSGPA